MSKYYNNYNNRNFKNNKHKKNSGKISSIISTVLVVFAILAVFGGLAELMHRDSVSTKVEYKTIYFIPSEEWESDGSLYGVWCWSASSMPAASFVLATDENKDGVYEFKINQEYTGLTFVDLKPDTNQLGANWDNKRAQTDDLTVPTDKNVYYHQYCNEWSADSNMLYNVTTSETTVYLDNTAQWAAFQIPVVYYFDKTGKNEPDFVQMTQYGAHDYTATIPAGFTHIVFLEYDESGTLGSWDNVLNQTSDLIIPMGEANHYDLVINDWFAPDVE